MALLDIQAMDTARDDTRGGHGGGGGGGGSHLSVALCDSFASVLLCL
jgi:Lanthionine-containing peptide SapB precursor RamS